MKILVTGAGGMIGRKLASRPAVDGTLGDEPIEDLALADVVVSTPPAGLPRSARALQVDLADPGAAAALAAGRPDVIFHLAAIVSGEAEADFEKGYRVNLDGTHLLLEAIRREGSRGPYRPRVVLASSIAVFGAPLPDRIGDDLATTPLTSYGTQKAIGELLLTDHSRRGFLDGVALRLPTICLRPGAPNRAASGFFSSILREPLIGKEAVLPVSTDVRHWFASPRAAVGFLLHAARMDLSRLGWRRALNMPGLSATVGEEIEALRRVAGDRAVALIRHEPDQEIARIVQGWARGFEARRARELGFVAEASFDEIVRAHVEDELGGRTGG